MIPLMGADGAPDHMRFERDPEKIMLRKSTAPASAVEACALNASQ
jgi:hypothetical protein